MEGYPLEVTMKTEKKCPSCSQVKPAECFGTRKQGGRTYLASHCRQCRTERQRTFRKTPEGKAYMLRDNTKRRSDPETYARQLASWRKRYHADDAFRHSQIEKSREKIASNSVRVTRIVKLAAYFAGREGWLRVLAAIVCDRPDAQGLQWISCDVDSLCTDYGPHTA